MSAIELVVTIWACNDAQMDEKEIIERYYKELASFCGTEKKLADMPKEGPDRNRFFRNAFHGTVANYILAARKLGEFVQQQFILTMLKKSGLELKSVLLQLNCNREAIALLTRAQRAGQLEDELKKLVA